MIENYCNNSVYRYHGKTVLQVRKNDYVVINFNIIGYQKMKIDYISFYHEQKRGFKTTDIYDIDNVYIQRYLSKYIFEMFDKKEYDYNWFKWIKSIYPHMTVSTLDDIELINKYKNTYNKPIHEILNNRGLKFIVSDFRYKLIKEPIFNGDK